MKSSCVVLLALLLNVNSVHSADPTRGQINDPDGYTNVRSGPSTNEEVVAKVQENEVFQILKYGESWSVIKTPGGKVGYMHTSRISPLENSGSDDDDYQPPVYSEEDRAKILGVEASSADVSSSSQESLDERIVKAEPFWAAGRTAANSGNYAEAFEQCLKAWNIFEVESNTEVRFVIINHAFRCVDWSDREPPSDRVLSILERCPAPVSQYQSSRENFGLEQIQYGMMQTALSVGAHKAGNYESAEIYLSRSEAYMERGLANATEYAREYSTTLATLRQEMVAMRALIVRNRGSANLNNTIAIFKAFLGNNSGGAAGTIRCPHCRNGDVYFDKQNALGHWVTGSKPCIECHGTGWVTAVRP